MRRKGNKKTGLLAVLLILVLLISVGYAALTTTLNINGTATLKKQSWSVYFNNVQVKEGSVSGAKVTTAPTVPNGSKTTTTLSWNVSMDTPGEYYEFNVDVVNEGSIDAMIQTATADIVTSALTTDQKKYLDYTIKYSDGTEIEQYDKLPAGTTETITVKLLFKNDESVNPSDLPSTNQTGISLNYTTNYVPADGNAIDKTNISLQGKSALFVGDSVAYGQGNNGKSWSYYINNEYNLSNCTNVAVSGASWTYNSTSSNSRIINQYKNNTQNYDFIILEGGINDLTYGSTWGEVTDSKTIVSNSQIIAEAMDEAFNTALTKWPNSRIGYILLYNTEDSGRANHNTQLDAYHSLIISICQKWNIPVFDMYSGRVIENNVEVTFDDLLDVHNTTYLEDGLHLNGAGYEKTYRYIAEWMQRLPKLNNTPVNNNTNQENTEVFTAFGTLSRLSDIRYCVEPALTAGDIVNFASDDLWNTYKFAIGSGTGYGLYTTWIDDGYQSSAFTVQTSGYYTIMVAKQDNSKFTAEDLEFLALNLGKR